MMGTEITRMTNENLVAMTLRLDAAVHAALDSKAKTLGWETADYAASVIARDVEEELKSASPSVADRLAAERELKLEAIQYARSRPFDEHLTLHVFRHLRANFSALYETAIGGKGDVRGNHIQARVNRSLGALIKIAAGAERKLDAQGAVLKEQIRNEYILGYTRLRKKA
jgi:hypothetical protein